MNIIVAYFLKLQVMMMLIPEAWQNDALMPQVRRGVGV